jgi:hypothetical protein
MQIPTAAQAVPVPVHYHHYWLVILIYLLGWAFHVALQVDAIARSGKTAYAKRRQVLAYLWPRIAARAFVATMLFLLVWQHPELIQRAASLFGYQIGKDESGVISFPMNNAIAGLYGFFSDSLLGYLPFLKGQLPAVEPPMPPPGT